MCSKNTLPQKPQRGRSNQGNFGTANYQVFLSFRGPDTRQGFVDCLYHFMVDAGIRVFKDNEDNPLGEKINKILEAIENSMICIPVFSKNYASSKWCLRELAKAIELKKRIIPIFYDVTPEDVTLKTSLYVDTLGAIRGKMEGRELSSGGKDILPEEIEQWKKALQEVGTFTGRELKHTGYGEFCKSMVIEVSFVLKIKEKMVTDHLVGMDAYVETMLNLLDIKAHDVRYVGIHGMGGIGKTTLAKVIFNQLSHQFEHSSFLSDTRESLLWNGIVYLQKQLLSDMGCKSRDISDSDEGIKIIMATSRNKKLLLVLDDVNQKVLIDKLAGNSNWFAPGSRIIVTSRDKRVLEFEESTLEGGNSEQSKVISSLEMQEMDFYEALELFNRHAFGTFSPPREYIDLASEAVSVSGYLPLSLEIIGSLLRGKSIEYWKKKIKALTKTPPKSVQQKLMISYEALDHRTQQMFLDIACCLVNADYAVYMWESCNFDVESGMEDLISMSLVKIVDNVFWMHDHLRDLGRNIVYSENDMDPGKRSRLWKHEDVLGILERREGTEKVESLILLKPCDITLNHHPNTKVQLQHFTARSFKKLKKLRFLELWPIEESYSLNLTGDFRGLLPNLRWLSWHACPSHLTAKNLNLVNLVVLDLSYAHGITEHWNGWSKMKIGNTLKVLDLSYCWYLRRTPDLSKFRSLEKLILEGCIDLIQIDSSIGMSKSLKHLNVRDCPSLEGLPEELCSLENLEEILVRGSVESSHRPFTLPQEIGNLKSLANLELVDVRITELPVSICRLKKLKRLSLRGCYEIDKLPDSLGDLKSLLELNISDTMITQLPESVGSLTDLNVIRTRSTTHQRNFASRCFAARENSQVGRAATTHQPHRGGVLRGACFHSR